MKILKPLVLSALAMLLFGACNSDRQLMNDLNRQSDKTNVQPRGPEVENGQPIPGQYIVVFKENIDFSELRGKSYDQRARQMKNIADRFIHAKGLANREIPITYNSMVKGFVAQFRADELEELRNDKRVAYIEQDRIMKREKPPWAGGGNGGGGGNSGQETPWGISRVNGGGSYNGSGVAWILDSGIDLDHPELNVDASRGFNAFTKGKASKSLDDGDGHGTHVSGTIAAIDNNEGVIGVAPGATVIPVKVLDHRGSGTYSGVIAGVDYVGATGGAGDVANMSLGGPASQTLDDAVVAASNNGIKFIIAAGNDSDDANNYSPARANGSNIFTISAMEEGDNWANFSNYANPPVDYCGPGVSIKSCWKDGGYNTISGTSMAAPHAAGVLLLGNASSGGTVSGDPDGNADPIIVH